jgi:hypothetical protein
MWRIPILVCVCTCVRSTGQPTEIVGVFDSYTNSLPNVQLPHVPLLGNGALGLAFDSWNYSEPAAITAAGPGFANTLDIWVNSNNMWACSAASDSQYATGNCQTIAFGGVSISLLPSYSNSSETLSFYAEQRIATAQIYTRWTTAAGSVFVTLTYIDPQYNVAVTNCTWMPAGGESESVAIAIKTWVTNIPGIDLPAKPTASAADCLMNMVNDFTYAAVARLGTNLSVSSPTIVWNGLGVAVIGASDNSSTCSVTTNDSASQYWEVVLATSVRSGETTSVVLIQQDVVGSTSEPPADPLETVDGILSAVLNGSLSLDSIENRALKWWFTYWSRSTVNVTGYDDITAFWYGAQYILACASSVRPEDAPPGLYGPFTSSDNPNWRGDYTLDYNFESFYYGVMSSNHVEHMSGYLPTVLAWTDSGRKMAQLEAAAANVTCPTSSIHMPCHLGPWGMQSYDESVYMHWNGNFLLLPLISQWEYTQNTTVAGQWYDFLSGINGWWACFLQNVTFGNGTHQYFDWNPFNPDQEHEEVNVSNPQIGLAMISRTFQAQLDIAAALGKAVPSYVADIAQFLAPYNHALGNVSSGHTSLQTTVWTGSLNATVQESDAFATYPVWPSEAVRPMESSASVQALAQASSRLYSDFVNGRPVDLFSVAVLSGTNTSAVAWTPDDVIQELRGYLNVYFGGNLLPYAPGGGVENVGITRAINDMLVRTVFYGTPEAFVQLFPFWSRSVSVAFTGLVVKGAVVVDASFDNAKQSVVNGSVVIRTLLDRAITVRIQVPWPSDTITDLACSSNTVEPSSSGHSRPGRVASRTRSNSPCAISNGICSFQIGAGEACTLSYRSFLQMKA